MCRNQIERIIPFLWSPKNSTFYFEGIEAFLLPEFEEVGRFTHLRISNKSWPIVLGTSSGVAYITLGRAVISVLSLIICFSKYNSVASTLCMLSAVVQKAIVWVGIYLDSITVDLHFISSLFDCSLLFCFSF